MSIKIIQPGALSLIQDSGRFGFMQYGVTQSGAMDQISYAAANHIAGNPAGAAEIEMTLMGLTAEFTEDAVIAVTGADMDAKLDGAAIDMYAPVQVLKGQTLSFGTVKSGVRGYLAVRGGFDVPAVMGSRSTNLRSKIGGVSGRAIAAGDEIRIGETAADLEPDADGEKGIFSRGLAFPMSRRELEHAPKFEKNITVRVVLGPQAENFTEAGIKAFEEGSYKVLPQSDRMGMRLSGPKVESKSGYDIISDGILFGSVQITNGGEPIVMMADHQTTGGYAKIATAVSFDLPKLAQLPPGGTVHFEVISPEKAQELYRKPEDRYRSEKTMTLSAARHPEKDGSRRPFRGGWGRRL